MVFFFFNAALKFWQHFFLLFIFRERGREGGREGEKYQRVVATHAPPTGDLACNTGMCPDWESNWQPFAMQSSAQSTEPHQPGLFNSKHLIDSISNSSTTFPEWEAESGYPEVHEVWGSLRRPPLHTPGGPVE